MTNVKSEKKWYDHPPSWAYAVKMHQSRDQCMAAISQTLPGHSVHGNVSASAVKSALIKAGEWVGDRRAIEKAVKDGKPPWLPAIVDWLKTLKERPRWDAITHRAQYVCRVCDWKAPVRTTVEKVVRAEGFMPPKSNAVKLYP